MSVYYGFTRRSYCGDTVNGVRATIMPVYKPVLFRTPVRAGESRLFKKGWNHWGHFPMIAGSTRRIPIQCGACLRRYGVVPCLHWGDAGTENRDSVKEA